MLMQVIRNGWGKFAKFQVGMLLEKRLLAGSNISSR